MSSVTAGIRYTISQRLSGVTDGRLFHSPGPAAPNALSPKVLYVRLYVAANGMNSSEQGEYCRSGSAAMVIAIRSFRLEPLYKLSTLLLLLLAVYSNSSSMQVSCSPITQYYDGCTVA